MMHTKRRYSKQLTTHLDGNKQHIFHYPHTLTTSADLIL